MKTEISWTFLGLVAAWLVSGLGLVAYPQFAGLGTFVFVLLGWIISLCLHEYAHAATASAFGDTTIADSGYLTLNPRHYFTGAQSLILPVLAVIFGGIALPGGAVMIRNDLIRTRWQRSVVALSGPFVTLVCTLLAYAAAR
ncbi:MAG: site-2 protease family protein, partial [Asticcacaulis sp.]|nr:site-2 protease family protein [Asticcacaulis sp.]